MRAVVAWQETPPEKDGVRNVCYDLCFKPDGSQLVAGVGARVLVYDAADGELLHALKGHKDAVYAVAYASNGKHFASGGADKTVIIWTSKAQGILKYTHNDSIQCLAYNPISQQLASGTASDFGLWSPEQKSVAKHKVPSKVVCMAWSADGMLLALGLYDGTVSLRDKAGTEKAKWSASSSAVWSLAWSPGDQSHLAVGCLDGQLKFFSSSGSPKFKERAMEGDVLSLSCMNADYMLAGGSDKCVHLMTREGVYLTKVASRDSWVWAVAARPKATNFIAVGCEDGSVLVLQLAFSTVHGLYGDRYVYRDTLSDVIIQHMITEQKVRIKCRDYVKKVAVYKDRVAIQLPSRVVLYQLEPGAGELDMQYHSAARINKKLECNLLVVTSQHIVLCQERRLQLYDFEGTLVREWLMDAVIRYIKVAGGPPGKEGLLLGLKSGAVLKIFVDNAFPIPLVKHASGIRCLDISSSRCKLALIDESSTVVVYDLNTKALLYEEKGGTSVAWNSQFEDMLCFSGSGQLTLKTADFQAHAQKMQGFVVGFKGSKVFCLQYVNMATIDIPQGGSMIRFLERGDVQAAYQVACLGVTEADWRTLAQAALQAMDVEVARAAYIRLRDVRSVELVNSVAAGLAAGTPRNQLLADVAAGQGAFDQAAQLYVSEGQLDKALEMFTSLCMFEEARQLAEQAAGGQLLGLKGGQQAAAGGSRGAAAVAELMGRQALWSEETANYEAAAEMYIKAGKFDRAISLLAKHGWWERLLTLMRSLDASKSAQPLRAAVAAFQQAGRYEGAKEGLLKLGDVAGLLALNVEQRRWDDAFLLLGAHAELRDLVYLPYAKWLLSQDRFEEACAAYAEGGRPELGLALLQQLADNAVVQCRFDDAAHGYYKLAVQTLRQLQGAQNPDTAADHDQQQHQQQQSFTAYYDTAELYFTYHLIHTTANQPFKVVDDATLFNAARFLLMRVSKRDPPKGIALSRVLLALAGLARAQRAFKLARFAYNRLQGLALPPAVAADVELASLMLRACPFTDDEELLPICYRCQATNTLLNTQGDFCTACGAPFHRSFATFEVLPLVEFELEQGISDAEALGLLGEDALATTAAGAGGGRGVELRPGQQGVAAGANVLRLDDDGGGAGVIGEEAAGCSSSVLDDAFAAQAAVPHTPIVLGRAALRRLRPSEVLQVRPGSSSSSSSQQQPVGHSSSSSSSSGRLSRWFRLLDDDQPVVVGPCGHFFEAEEYEMAVLEHGCAPFSREPCAHSEGDDDRVARTSSRQADAAGAGSSRSVQPSLSSADASRGGGGGGVSQQQQPDQQHTSWPKLAHSSSTSVRAL